MKIQQAYTTIEGRLAESKTKSERKVYGQLLAVLSDLAGRDLSSEQREPIEAALDALLEQGRNARELKKAGKRFVRTVCKTLSLVPHGHYTALGLAFGVAFGAALGPTFQGIAGIPSGTSGTGFGVGIGLILGYLIGSRLDVEAAKQNRVLKT